MRRELCDIIKQGRVICFSLDDGYLIDESTWNKAVSLYNTNNMKQFSAFLNPYVPLLEKHLGAYSYRIGGRVVQLDYALVQEERSVNGRIILVADNQNKRAATRIDIKCIRLYPRLLLESCRFIDAVVAHELAHASRFIEGREKDIYDDDWGVIEKKEKWEEFWADREMKKMLRLINPKYNNKTERLATLKVYQERARRNKVIGIKAMPGELWDRLFPFSYQ